MIIGLCGGSGSGKGAVCSIFNGLGVPSIDTDKVYHDLTSYMSDCLLEIKSAFGDSVVTDGALNRAKLAGVVFADGADNKRALLNDITHRHILARVRKDIAELYAKGYTNVIVDAPLLFESGFHKECDVIVGVIANADIRILRIMKRDGIDYSSAIRRIGSQLSDDELKKKCDYLITNNGGTEELTSSVAKLYDNILGGKNGKFNC